MTRIQSKRQRAVEQLTIAQDALAKALNFLGGKPRARSSKLPAPRDYQARSYIVSCIHRLDVAQVLLVDRQMGMNPAHAAPYNISGTTTGRMSTESNEAFAEKAMAAFPTILRDDFERQYDKERNPGC